MKVRRFIIVIIFYGTIAFILYNAAIPGEKSSQYSDSVIDVLSLNNEISVKRIIRKIAHVIEYSCLGLVSYIYFDFFKKQVFKVSIVVILLVSCADEIIQYFTYGRSGQISDVLLDTMSGIITLVLIRMIRKGKTKLVKC